MKGKTGRSVTSEQVTSAAHQIGQLPRQTVEPASAARDVSNQSYSLMDEEDIAEMSMIAEEIESAEKFNLTFETVEASKLYDEIEAREFAGNVSSLSENK
ncbi:hypothetical protein KIN20_038437 [Parelaphostrongylus tenuis]|uniref:Uncharacterized protein n=1 Tax=Parelaphostrongylus tenuis TaxID=148309 RepID=A0AAD5QYX2_PARTN|nr:hypothetical protein KIN20_038437 [Parelaphostrongylus tenuis]